uniref:LIM zinc-binding domain-containing protein n=1 Tax=Steinernema glaseri TaxID=37863 RepID=A0A1I7ZX43_9BILA
MLRYILVEILGCDAVTNRYSTNWTRKVCVHCKCDRSDHELGPNQVINVYQRLGLKPPGADMAKVAGKTRNDAPGSVAHGYAWVPPGLSRMKVEEYMSQLPNHCVPRVNSMGEKYRERQLMVQLPRQDLSVSYCKHLNNPTERKVFDEFVQARNEIALDIGYVSSNIPHSMECRKCKGVMERNEMAVVAPKLGENTGWHPACFICTTCEQLLIDLTYCVRDGLIYCERHYAELHKPRCSACDEDLIAYHAPQGHVLLRFHGDLIAYHAPQGHVPLRFHEVRCGSSAISRSPSRFTSYYDCTAASLKDRPNACPGRVFFKLVQLMSSSPEPTYLYS